MGLSPTHSILNRHRNPGCGAVGFQAPLNLSFSICTVDDRLLFSGVWRGCIEGSDSQGSIGLIESTQLSQLFPRGVAACLLALTVTFCCCQVYSSSEFLAAQPTPTFAERSFSEDREEGWERSGEGEFGRRFSMEIR